MKQKKFEERLSPFLSLIKPILPLGENDKVVPADLSRLSSPLEPHMILETSRFAELINKELGEARYGIGGYNEERHVYSRSSVFDSPDGGEPRRLHLGIDVWGEAGTDIYSPLPAIVHSFAFNNTMGDYGGTLILQHNLGGFIFHTLYGHLSMASVEEKKEGQEVEAGEWIGAFGKPEENGQWPPHLHFQIVIDMQHWEGDYPGVCRLSERSAWLENSPDPALFFKSLSEKMDKK